MGGKADKLIAARKKGGKPMYRVTILPQKLDISAREGENLLALLRRAGFHPDAPCGGEGRCGKCRVNVDGEERLACRTVVDRDLSVILPGEAEQRILTGGVAPGAVGAGCRLISAPPRWRAICCGMAGSWPAPAGAIPRPPSAPMW